MEIVLNHITRMTPRRICIAGIDPTNNKHVRPVTLSSDPLTPRLLTREGGFLQPGALIDIGAARIVGEAPEIEDRQTSTEKIRFVENLTDDDYLSLLEEVSSSDTRQGFHDHLEEIRPGKFAISEGCGEGSLAVVPINDVRLSLSFGRVEFSFPIELLGNKVKVKATDVRFFEDNYESPRTKFANDVASRLDGGARGFLMLGVARAMLDDTTGRRLHWLMGNGICFRDEPLLENSA